MTLQTYQKIKLLYNSILSVELDYTEKYSIGDILHFTEDYQCKGIIRRVKLCPDYSPKSKVFINVELI